MLLLVAAAGFSEGFAGFEWGASEEQLVEVFGDPFLDSDKIPGIHDIYYQTEIAGYDCFHLLRFDADRMIFRPLCFWRIKR